MDYNKRMRLIRINQLIAILFSYIIGVILINFVEFYLNNLSIIKTVYIMVYIYLFQLLIQGIKFRNVHSILEGNSYIKTSIYIIKKFLGINFILFLFLGIIILGLLLMSLFFSRIRYLMIAFMIIVLTFIYFMYNIKLFNLVDTRFDRYKFNYIKNKIKELWHLLFINLTFITVSVCLFNFVYYLRGFVFVFVVLLDFALSELNIRCLSMDL